LKARFFNWYVVQNQIKAHTLS